MKILTTFLMDTFEMMPINSFSLYFSLEKKKRATFFVIWDDINKKRKDWTNNLLAFWPTNLVVIKCKETKGATQWDG